MEFQDVKFIYHYVQQTDGYNELMNMIDQRYNINILGYDYISENKSLKSCINDIWT